ncbi:ComEC/Rec2 family competence protein [Elusimicrobiota bacterium]
MKSRTQFIIIIFSAIAVFLSLFILFNPRISPFVKIVQGRNKMGAPVLKVTYLYIGQGDATLIRDLREGGKVMLIDGGPTEELEEYLFAGLIKGRNYAKEVILPYLRKEGIKKIDYMVASHKDADHIGGLPYVIRNFNVGTVYDNGTRKATSYVKDLLAAIKEKKTVRYKIAKAGMELPFGENMICQVLGPLKKYSGTEGDENNASIVIRLTAGEVSFIFPGDTEIPAELDLMDYGKGLKTTVMKVAHHGSISSSSKPFLDRIMPEVAVFSCGRYNQYGFPTFEVLRRYEERGARLYRTDTDGSIEIITDGRKYRIVTER